MHQRLRPGYLEACDYLSKQRAQNAEIREGAKRIAAFSREALESFKPFHAKYGAKSSKEPRHLGQMLFPTSRAGSFGLLRDLHALAVLATDVQMATKILKDAARELRDEALHGLCIHAFGQNQRQQAWVDTIIKHTDVQSLVVPS